MKKQNKKQHSSLPKFVMTITIIMMIGTLLGAIGYLAQKASLGLVNGDKELKKVVKNEIGSWQIYGDEKYNFQIKYPPSIFELVINEKENSGKKEMQKEISFNINDNLKISIFIWNMEASEGNDLAEVKEKYNEVSIGGNYGWQSKQSYKTDDNNKDPLAIYFFETYLYSKTHIYQIEYRGIYSKENFDLYQKMVSTFEIREGETQKIKLYYYNKNHDPKFDCLPEAVLPVEREIPKTDTLIQDTINLLIKGEITEQEKSAGFSSEFPNPEFKLLGVALEDKVLTLNFTEAPSFTTGGACRTGLLAAQIIKTAEQFEGVEKVEFGSNELFQP